MSEFAESRSGYPKFFRASPFADEVARNASPVPALLAIAGCVICCACQSICLFIPTDSSVPRTVDLTEVFVAKDCAWLCASQSSPFQTPPFAGGSLSLAGNAEKEEARIAIKLNKA